MEDGENYFKNSGTNTDDIPPPAPEMILPTIKIYMLETVYKIAPDMSKISQIIKFLLMR